MFDGRSHVARDPDVDHHSQRHKHPDGHDSQSAGDWLDDIGHLGAVHTWQHSGNAEAQGLHDEEGYRQGCHVILGLLRVCIYGNSPLLRGGRAQDHFSEVVAHPKQDEEKREVDQHWDETSQCRARKDLQVLKNAAGMDGCETCCMREERCPTLELQSPHLRLPMGYGQIRDCDVQDAEPNSELDVAHKDSQGTVPHWMFAGVLLTANLELLHADLKEAVSSLKEKHGEEDRASARDGGPGMPLNVPVTMVDKVEEAHHEGDASQQHAGDRQVDPSCSCLQRNHALIVLLVGLGNTGTDPVLVRPLTLRAAGWSFITDGRGHSRNALRVVGRQMLVGTAKAAQQQFSAAGIHRTDQGGYS
mmetsp:Transcript_25626/g.56510  ORF Transcript_25626/g.56510 Transcript_25626/m.56510 type:complete len:360 (+) Transcript_25626:802-1881(+)